MDPRALRGGLVAAALARSPLAACSTPKREAVRDATLNRETPRAAYEYLKAMVRAEQPEAEWNAFSPAFKRRLSQQVGRTIDVGDYVQARSTVATNKRKEIQLLLESEVVGDKAAGDDVVVVTIRAGNQQARPRFVKLTTWELFLKGEGQPVAEFVPTTSDVIQISPTGAVELRIAPSDSTASFLRDIPQDRIQGFAIHEFWYLDDFGGIEAAVLNGLRGEPDGAQGGRGDRDAPTPRGAAPGGRPPPEPTPLPDPYAPPPPAPGPGSPDGSPPYGAPPYGAPPYGAPPDSPIGSPG